MEDTLPRQARVKREPRQSSFRASSLAPPIVGSEAASSNVALAESCASLPVFTQLVVGMAPPQAVISACASDETPVRADGTSAMVTDETSRIEKK
jgi:hypothetical protein